MIWTGNGGMRSTQDNAWQKDVPEPFFCQNARWPIGFRDDDEGANRGPRQPDLHCFQGGALAISSPIVKGSYA
jgi:hypothetical protein